MKPGFFKNEHLTQLEPLTRILFAGLWGLADRVGRLEDRPAKIKIEVLPADDCDVDAMLGQLARVELIVRYKAEGQPYIWIPKFLDHQNPHHREPDSKIPAYSRTAQGKPRASRGKARPSRAESGILNPESGILNPSYVAPEAARLAELLKTLMLENNPKAKTPPVLTAWTMEMDRLIRIDQRTPQETEAVIRWCQGDPFWRCNILSPAKLRKQFDQLTLKMKSAGSPNGSHTARLAPANPGKYKD